MKIDIISKIIDFDKLSKPWFDHIPTICKYNELKFKYNNKDDYDNSIIMEKNIHFIWIGSVINDKYMNTVINSLRTKPLKLGQICPNFTPYHDFYNIIIHYNSWSDTIKYY
jgi:hypothetical protein